MPIWELLPQLRPLHLPSSLKRAYESALAAKSLFTLVPQFAGNVELRCPGNESSAVTSSWYQLGKPASSVGPGVDVTGLVDGYGKRAYNNRPQIGN